MLAGMHKLNIADPDFQLDGDEPAGYNTGMVRMGRTVPSSKTGISVYQLPPAQSVCPYHYEHGEEEWILVLEGTPTLRDPDGEHVLVVSDVVFFPPGPAGAHKLTNNTDTNVRILMFSNINTPGSTVYPDSNKIGIWTGNPDDNILVDRASGVDYWQGE